MAERRKKRTATATGTDHHRPTSSSASAPDPDLATPNFRLAELRAAYDGNRARIRVLQSEIARVRRVEDLHADELRMALSNLRKRLQVGEAAAAKAHEKLRAYA